MKVSPRYMMDLIYKIEAALWNAFPSSKYKNVEAYIERWHTYDEDYNGNIHNENFEISRREDSNIDLPKTLHGIKDDELLFKMAVDLGIEIPGLVYSIAEIKGMLSSGYETAAATFENALQKVYAEPATAVCCANSALESIIKHICQNESIAACNKNDTLYDLVQHILKEFKYFPNKEVEQEIRSIGSGLLKAYQNIEAMRSKYADTSHGKTAEDYIIDEPLYAMFVVNAVTTVGLFLMNFYEKKYLPEKNKEAQNSPMDDDIPF